MKEGPSLEYIPELRREVCRGCKYLHTAAWLRAHDHVTNNYSCIHPDVVKDTGVLISATGPGRSIQFNAREMPDTPHWCPYKNGSDKFPARA